MATKKKPPPEAAPVEAASTPKTKEEEKIDLDEMREESRLRIFKLHLQQPFPVKQIKFKPQMVKDRRALAMAYIDARLVQDRLDEVVGVGGWEDSYKVLADGSVRCRLRVLCPIRYGYAHVTKSDVGSPSEQPDSGDRLKAAFSDALKRAAVKFGIGRYLYSLPAQWVDYDPVKKQLTQLPQLPERAIPKDIGPVYAYHEGEEAPVTEVEAASTEAKPAKSAEPPKAQEGPKEAKTPQAATSPQAKGDRPPDAKPGAKEDLPDPTGYWAKKNGKPPTLDDRLKDWAGKVAACDTPADLNAMKVGLKGEPEEYQVPIWKSILETIRQVGWAWDKDKKEFFDTKENDAIPF